MVGIRFPPPASPRFSEEYRGYRRQVAAPAAVGAWKPVDQRRLVIPVPCKTVLIRLHKQIDKQRLEIMPQRD
jgi:hypothetical protein